MRNVPKTLLRDVKVNLSGARASSASAPGPPSAQPPGTVSTLAPPMAYGDRIGYGTSAVLSIDPPVFLSGLAFKEFVGVAKAFGRRYGDAPAAFILYPTWSIASESKAAAVVASAQAHAERYPHHQLVYMCNTAEERDRLARGGLRALFLNKNFLVPEHVFRPLPEVEIEFDAIYNARFDPNKRHQLASGIPLLAYLTYDDPANTPETQREHREVMMRTLLEHPSHVLINPLDDGLPIRLPPDQVNQALNRAAVGLCLSHTEGANYASMEYLLAGLPVVSTPSIGGRDAYFDPEFCTICDPEPDAVRQAVESLRWRQIPRHEVRQRTLAKIEPQRRQFVALVDDLIGALGGMPTYGDDPWPFCSLAERVTWDEYSNHVAAFARRQPSAVEDQRDPDAVLESLLSQVHDVQMQPSELRPIMEAIQSRRPCGLLVFGCGNDSVLWERANEGGRTVFVEDDPVWADRVRAQLRGSEIYVVDYGTELAQWEDLLHAPDRLVLDLPDEVATHRFDVVVVDGPPGHARHFELTGRPAPGRMKSIYMASTLVARRGFVFVHDCDRQVEQSYATEYLGADRLYVRAEGRSVLQGYEF